MNVNHLTNGIDRPHQDERLFPVHIRRCHLANSIPSILT